MSDPLNTSSPRLPGSADAAVERLASLMRHKLDANMHKAHWSTVDNKWLLERLRQEWHELEEALIAGDRVAILSECADVANFAMMIADNVASSDGGAA
ncbi:MAG: hypothetical protein ACWGPR_11845 [Candidatus Deferrimicrobiaceae bacterium]